MTKEIYVDGACSGNPGPTRIAVFSEDFGIKTVLDDGMAPIISQNTMRSSTL